MLQYYCGKVADFSDRETYILNKKLPVGAVLGALSALHFFAFLIFYIPNFAVQVENYEAVLYVVQFVGHVFKFVLPLIAATLVFVSCIESWGKIIANIAIISISSLAYNFFYYYLRFLVYGNDSIEASLLSLGASALEYLLFASLTLLFCFIMRFGTVRAARRDSIKNLPLAYRDKPTKEMLKQIDLENVAEMPRHVAESRTVDVTSPVTFGIFCACFTQFALQLLYALFGFISNLIVIGDYSTKEMTYIIIVLLFIFAELFIAHFTCYFAKYIFTRSKTKNVDDESVGE